MVYLVGMLHGPVYTVESVAFQQLTQVHELYLLLIVPKSWPPHSGQSSLWRIAITWQKISCFWL